MLKRVLEPEVMDTPEEARDYDAMDHGAVNVTFCDDLLSFASRNGKPALGKRTSRVIDFGTGTALIPLELCGRAEVYFISTGQSIRSEAARPAGPRFVSPTEAFGLFRDG